MRYNLGVGWRLRNSVVNGVVIDSHPFSIKAVYQMLHHLDRRFVVIRSKNGNLQTGLHNFLE